MTNPPPPQERLKIKVPYLERSEEDIGTSRWKVGLSLSSAESSKIKVTFFSIPRPPPRSLLDQCFCLRAWLKDSVPLSVIKTKRNDLISHRLTGCLLQTTDRLVEPGGSVLEGGSEAQHRLDWLTVRPNLSVGTNGSPPVPVGPVAGLLTTHRTNITSLLSLHSWAPTSGQPDPRPPQICPSSLKFSRISPRMKLEINHNNNKKIKIIGNFSYQHFSMY